MVLGAAAEHKSTLTGKGGIRRAVREDRPGGNLHPEFGLPVKHRVWGHQVWAPTRLSQVLSRMGRGIATLCYLDSRMVSSAAQAAAARSRGSCGTLSGLTVQQHRPSDSTQPSPLPDGARHRHHVLLGLTHGVVGCTGSCGTLSGLTVQQHRPPDSTQPSPLPDGGWHRHHVLLGLTHGVVGCTGSCGTLSGLTVQQHRPPDSTQPSPRAVKEGTPDNIHKCTHGKNIHTPP